MLNYTFNYVDLIIVGIVMLLAISGSFKGIALTIINFLRYAIGLPLCFVVSRAGAEPIYNSLARERIYNWVNESILADNNISEVTDRLTQAFSSIPSFISDSMGFSDKAIEGFSSTEQIANLITDSVIQPIALFVIKMLLFIITFVLFFALTGLIIRAVRRHNRKKREKTGRRALKTADRVIGACFGILRGMIIVFAFVTIVNLFIVQFDYQSNDFLNTASQSILFNEILKFNPINLITEGAL